MIAPMKKQAITDAYEVLELGTPPAAVRPEAIIRLLRARRAKLVEEARYNASVGLTTSARLGIVRARRITHIIIGIRT